MALLAGVSVDYYTRLEQGREKGPSAQVVGALASALRLHHDGRLHLFRLAGLTPRSRVPASRAVDPLLRQLLDSWSAQPALIYDRCFDVLASNELADALFSRRTGSDATNLMELIFLGAQGQTLYRDWEEVARNAVAGFRLNYGQDPDDPQVRTVLSRLLTQSRAFTAMWSENDARGKRAGTKRLQHPEVGPITLEAQTFDVRSVPGQELVVYHAAPGSESADALGLLGTLAATRRDRASQLHPGEYT